MVTFWKRKKRKNERTNVKGYTCRSFREFPQLGTFQHNGYVVKNRSSNFKTAICTLRYRIKSSSSALNRTIWDEVCSIFLCFISPLIKRNEIRAVDLAGLGFQLLDRMGLLCEEDASVILQTRYQSTPIIVTAMRNAPAILFPSRQWRSPPGNADSLDWWNTLRDILDSFVTG